MRQRRLIVGLDQVQLHGDESPEYASRLGLPVIKVLPADPDLVERAATYPKLDLLLDHPSGGGGGQSWDFERARPLVAAGRRVWIAGGLSPENVADAVRRALPHGVDASSGLESSPGRKNPTRVAAFVAAARAAIPAGEKPDVRGYFGEFGGRYVPEILLPAVEELRSAWSALREDPAFWEELRVEHATYIGRPTPLYKAERLSAELGLRVYLKREELAHTGAHKINNAIGQALIAGTRGARSRRGSTSSS